VIVCRVSVKHFPFPRTSPKPDWRRRQSLSPQHGIAANTIVIPTIGVNALIDQIRVTLTQAPGKADGVMNGELDIPRQVDRVGVWNGSPTLESNPGSTLMAGHTDNKNQGLTLSRL